MPLKTVRVPSEMEPLFAAAESVVSRYFRERRADPERGTIEISGERYVLVRAASLSVEFFALVDDLYGPGREAEAAEFARNILFDLAHAVGRADARTFHAKMRLEDPIEKLSAGPVHFAYSGWAFVDIFAESSPRPDRGFYLIYDHPYSFESDAWLRSGRRVDFPVCIMNAGYSSGWCEESFGVELIATEILCRARGDDACRFIMAHPEEIEAHVERYIERSPALASRLRAHQIPGFFARKRMEEELRRARDELERRVADRTADLLSANELLVREMAEREKVERRLRQTHKLEAVGRLAGGIAHDFNNLMGVVIGHASMLERRMPETDPLRAQLREIRLAGQRAASLTHQLLAFSRVQVIERDILDPARVVADLRDMLVRLIGEDVELVTRAAEDAGCVQASRVQLEQVIVNLVVNGRDAMPEGGTLAIDLARAEVPGHPDAPPDLAPGPYVLLSVADTGLGMDEATMARAFDPFFTTKEDGRGTGLGLSTVYAIVKQSRGAVSVSSAPGAGSTFRVWLPRSDERPAPPEGERHAVSGPRGTEGILLVEDQDSLRAVVRAALEHLGYAVVEAAGPADALRVAGDRAHRIDLLLTDVVMPRMGGRELAERVIGMRPEARVLYMSGYADDALLREGVLEGAAFLQKPFTPDDLARKVRAVLDQPADRAHARH